MFAALTMASASAPAQSVKVTEIKIADGIYQFTAEADGYVTQLNSIAVVTDRDVLVFDTDTRPSTAATVLASIRRITPKPVRYVVNSHWHPDHWSGNEVYAQAFPNLEIIASSQTAEFMRNVANAWPARWPVIVAATQASLDSERATGKDAAGKPVTDAQVRQFAEVVRSYGEYAAEAMTVHRTYPTLTFSDSLTLLHGGREFRFMSVTGDAVGTTVLYLPRERVLLTGDVVSYPIPFTRPSPVTHAKTLRTLAELDAQTIIPGHGPAFHDNAYLNLEAELLEAVTAQVIQAVRAGLVSISQVQQAVNVDSLRLRFTHGDAELDDEFKARVDNIVRSAVLAARDGQEFK